MSQNVQEIFDLADALSQTAHDIDMVVNTQLDPLSQQAADLKRDSSRIAAAAIQVRALGLSQLEKNVRTAIDDLTARIGTAQQRIKQIQSVQKILSIVAAVLSVAAAAASKNPLQTVQGVANLVKVLEGALHHA